MIRRNVKFQYFVLIRQKKIKDCWKGMGKLDIEAWMDKVLQNDLLNKIIDMGDVKASIDRAKWFEKDSVWVFRFMKLREDNIPSIVKENNEAKAIKLQPDELLIVPAGTLCGMQTSNGIVYTEIICTGKDINMNANVKTNEVFALKNLISYEEGSIANMDVVSTPDMKYVLMAFDEGTGLTPHRAPGNAIVFALEGKATIGYEGKDYELSEGECFRFEKNGLHSVTANGKFKMALLLVLE